MMVAWNVMRSTTNRIHWTIRLNESSCVDFVAFFFGRNGVQHRLCNAFVCGVGSQQLPDVRFFHAEQAVSKTAVRCQAKPIAASAEWLADTGDQSNAAFSISKFKILRRRVSQS